MRKAFYKNNLNFVTIALVYLIGHDERKIEYVHPNSKVVDQPFASEQTDHSLFGKYN